MADAIADIEKQIGPDGEIYRPVVAPRSTPVVETPSPPLSAGDEGTADWYSLYCIYLAVIADGIALGIIVPYRYARQIVEVSINII